MRIPRLYVDVASERPTAVAGGNEIQLPEDRSHYLQRVLRRRAGDEIELLDGCGRVAMAKLVNPGKKCTLLIEPWEADTRSESPVHSTLALVLSRGQRMDYALQKSVELGVTRIVLLTSQRCEVQLSDQRAGQRMRHWRETLIGAMEQSGRTLLPQIAAPVPLSDWLRDCSAQLRWMLHLAGAPVRFTTDAVDSIAVTSGPEGGFTDAEIEAARAEHFTPVTLGARTLRAETAPLVALTLAQFGYADLAKERPEY